jgi:hypothetical protein
MPELPTIAIVGGTGAVVEGSGLAVRLTHDRHYGATDDRANGAA